ncbi:hypothetical protein BJ508DRAFT_325285 [Ascobolus immersus RN42]|uniref:DASH complex subunit SPC19 n=1 Tax=Ascobolus immersus RN42 TaxID=1160509 RepID=A0A3N4I8Z1_ASCIM|nr:hypothetical protein BJ508DRAFT_325285 [Ascobolus immersus RN42]
MDLQAITTQALTTIDTLSAQLQDLQTQQTTLLTSLRLTQQALPPPATAQITPILTQLPHYEQKLARLKQQMTSASQQVENLKRRSEQAKVRRGRNLERIKEVRGREREADRTVLRARVVTVREGGSGTGTPERVGSPALSIGEGAASPVGSMETSTTEMGSVRKITRKKKKVRQVVMD